MRNRTPKRNFLSVERLTAIFLFVSLTLSNGIGYAGLNPLSVRGSVKVSAEVISIPEEFGKIEESFQGSSGKTIIYIQDAHDSLEAQENIAKIINYLVEQYDVKTVLEEGYEGPVPTDEYFGFIKNSEIKEKVSYFLLDKLRLGGAEYAHINRKKDFRLIGADSIKLHLENIKWYRKNSKHQEETERDLTALKKEIDRLANQYLSKELKDLIKLRERLDEKQIPLLDYLRRIWPAHGEVSGTPSYPNLALLFTAAKSQDKAALEKVKAIDTNAELEEINSLEDDIANHFLSDQGDRQIFHYHKSLELLRRLNAIELTPPKYEAIQKTLKKLNTRKLAQFVVEQTKKSAVLSKRWEENIQNAIRFYEVSKKRDSFLEGNFREFTQSREQIAILVFGGFHKERIQEILKQKNLSFLIVSPKITNIDTKHQNNYKRLMSIGYLPFEVPLYVRQAARAESRFLQVKEGGLKIETAFRSELRALSESLRRNPNLDRSAFLLEGERTSLQSFRSEARNTKENRLDSAFLDAIQKLNPKAQEDYRILRVLVTFISEIEEQGLKEGPILKIRAGSLHKQILEFKQDHPTTTNEAVAHILFSANHSDTVETDKTVKDYLLDIFFRDKHGKIPNLWFLKLLRKATLEDEWDEEGRPALLLNQADQSLSLGTFYSEEEQEDWIRSGFDLLTSMPFDRESGSHQEYILNWVVRGYSEVVRKVFREYQRAKRFRPDIGEFFAEKDIDEINIKTGRISRSEVRGKPSINDDDFPAGSSDRFKKAVRFFYDFPSDLVSPLFVEGQPEHLRRRTQAEEWARAQNFAGAGALKLSEAFHLIKKHYFAKRLINKHGFVKKVALGNWADYQFQIRQTAVYVKALLEEANGYYLRLEAHEEYAAEPSFRNVYILLPELIENTGAVVNFMDKKYDQFYLETFSREKGDESVAEIKSAIVSDIQVMRQYLEVDDNYYHSLAMAEEELENGAYDVAAWIIENVELALTAPKPGRRLSSRLFSDDHPGPKRLRDALEKVRNHSARAEVRQIATMPSQLSIPERHFDLPELISKSQDIPASLFFAYDEVKEKTAPLRKGLLALAHLTQGSKLKLVIYSADRTDLGLKEFRNLGVVVTQEGLEMAFGTFGEKSNGRNVNASTKADLLKKELASLSGLRLKHILVQDESEIWAVYLRAITNPDQPIPGLDDSQGYYQVVGEFLRSKLRSYQASLVIEMAA